MLKQKEAVRFCKDLFEKGAIYIWGGNGEIIDSALCEKLYKYYGSSTYNKAYFNAKLKEGKGKIGADCSGSIFPLAKVDRTARGHFNACSVTGPISEMPKDRYCLVFNKNLTHVAHYLGDGTTFEMKSSKENAVIQDFNRNKSRWTYYGLPKYISDYDIPVTVTEREEDKSKLSSEVVKNIQRFLNTKYSLNVKVDGKVSEELNTAIVKAVQMYLNKNYKAKLKVDGKFGPATKAATVLISGRNDLTYLCQAKLYLLGYDMSHSINKKNDFDSNAGKGTRATVLEFQLDTRTLKADSLCGPATQYLLFRKQV